MVMRQQMWIDQHVQGVLVGRVLLYWLGILIYVSLSIGCSQWWQNPEWTLTEHLWGMFDQVWPCLPTLVLLLPLVIVDIVRLSNRFAGPVYRMRNHLEALNKNSHTTPLNFRDDDYWQQLAEPINTLQQRILVLEQQVETLSYVHKSLSQGVLPTEESQQASPAAQPASGHIVDEPLSNALVSEAPMAASAGRAADEDAVTPTPPIPPLPMPPLADNAIESLIAASAS